MKRKVLSILLACSMVLSLAACGGSKEAAQETPAATETETKERLLKLTDHNGVDETDIYCPPAMDAQVALYELGNYLLGEGWYVVDPLSVEQINTIMVYEIERKYKRVK